MGRGTDDRHTEGYLIVLNAFHIVISSQLLSTTGIGLISQDELHSSFSSHI